MDTAKRLVTLPERPPRNLEERIQDQVEEYRTLHAAGLTSIRHPGSSIEHFRLLEEMKRRGLLTMRVTFLMRMRARSAAEVDAAIDAWGLEPQAGDEWLRLGGVKLGVDGGFEGGLMRDPYEEPWGQGGTYHGLRTMPQDVFNEVATQLGRRGWRVATHAVVGTSPSTRSSRATRPRTRSRRLPASAGRSSTASSPARTSSPR